MSIYGAILLTFLALPASESLLCFHCTSLETEDCYEPWKYLNSNTGVLNISTIGGRPCQSCTVHSYIIQEWIEKTHVVRSCASTSMSDQCDGRLIDTDFGAHCACNTRLCNTGSSRTVLATETMVTCLLFFSCIYGYYINQV